jgi:predicted transposase/invertase (TIGR01784 family)
MARYLDPKNDLLFKKIFGEHKELLISFLNAFLPLEEGTEVTEIEYLSPEQVPETPLGKNSIVDVRCTDNKGRAFIVEMQSEWSAMFRNRLLVNGSKAVVNQMSKKTQEEKAKDFSLLQPVYVLAVVDDEFSDKEKKEWYHHLKIMNPKNPDEVIKGLEFILLEVPKCKPETWTLAHKKIAVLWMRFLRELEGLSDDEIPNELLADRQIRHAIEICKESSLTEKEKAIYDRYQDNILWQNGIKNMENEIVDNKKTIEDKNKTIEDNNKTIEDKDKEIAELKRLLESKV